MTWLCAKCGAKLERDATESVEDSDGISGDAHVTDWRCTACAEKFSHWHIPRAGIIDGKMVDVGRDFWFGDDPKFVFDSPWHALSDPSSVEAELARELTPGHPLHGKTVRAVARHEARDDVVFTSDDAVWIVHLTWTRHEEKDPRWPTTTRLRSLAHFDAMLEDRAPAS